MEYTLCNFCGSDQPIKQYELTDWMTQSTKTYTLVRCGKCGLFYLNPRPSSAELAMFYPEEYAPFQVPSTNTLQGNLKSKLQRSVWQRRAGWLRRFTGVNGGDLLDVGCARGDFILAMQQNSAWHCTGIEISNATAAATRQRTGARIIEQDLLETDFSQASFDLVTFWDVLEHLPDPLHSLQKAYHVLRPGGWLALRVPDPDSLSARIFKQDWVNHDPPRHFHAFPKKLLVSQLDQMGFQEISFHHLTGDYFSFTMSLSNYFSRIKAKKLAYMARSLSQSAILRFFTIPLFIMPAWLKMGASILYLAKKPSPAKDQHD